MTTLPRTVTWTAPWDDGIQWRTAVVSAVDADFLAISVAFAKQVLNIVRTDQDELIEHYIKAATGFGERLRGEHITPKTMTMTLSGFPDGSIEFADAPVYQIVSLGYLDEDGDSQTYNNVSPHEWVFEPAGRSGRARLSRIPGGDWPAAYERNDAVTVTFRVGYEFADEIPAEIKQAIAVTVGEFYKNPDLSNSDGQSPNLIGLEHFWPRRWSNAF